MAQKKAHEVESWLARPEASRSVVLLYGPDRGMVAERAQKVAGSTGMSFEDPFSVVRLDAADIDQAPGRLLEEARTIPMFSDRRLVWIRNASAASKTLADEVRELAADPVPGALVLIEAGELRKGTALRTVAEAAEAAISLPCYPDEARDLDSLIDETLQAAGKSIGLEALQALKRNLGGDRLASRGELEKLALYVHDRSSVDLDDVLAVLGDVAGQSLEDASTRCSMGGRGISISALLGWRRAARSPTACSARRSASSRACSCCAPPWTKTGAAPPLRLPRRNRRCSSLAGGWSSRP